MSSAITQQSSQQSGKWTPSQLALVQQQIAQNCTQEEIEFFQQVCNKTGLDPFSRQIYAIKRGGKNPKMTIQVSIDGFRAIADRSGKYSGSQTFWCDANGNWFDVWLKTEPPAAAKTVCYRIGSDHPFVAVALWAELAQWETVWRNGQATNEKKLATLWAQMPAHMIGKVSEAQALRKAFPAELSGLYSTDEIPMPADNVIEAEVINDSAEKAALLAKAKELGEKLGLTSIEKGDAVSAASGGERDARRLSVSQLQNLVSLLENTKKEPIADVES